MSQVHAPFSDLHSTLNPKPKTAQSRDHKKQHGQFMTPPSIAHFMACRLLDGPVPEVLRILEPAAGNGVLISALCDALFNLKVKPKQIEIVCYEIDPSLVPKLFFLLTNIQSALISAGTILIYTIKNQDFLLCRESHKFDYIITNPPYFKLRASDPRCKDFSDLINGQPNIYAIFMAKISDMLAKGGRLCCLTPRSWTTGLYFKGIREKLIRQLDITSIHAFKDKKNSFPGQKIQQDSIITWFSLSSSQSQNITISSSQGASDINSKVTRSAPKEEIIRHDNGLVIFPTGFSSEIFLSQQTLVKIGLQASTGKVVPFRAKDLIVDESTPISRPLIWMQHIKRMKITWPLEIKKEHILEREESKKLSIPAGNYVLVRRFSPRQSHEHVIAAPFIGADSEIYIENHVNVISAKGRSLTPEEAIGLAIYLNSKEVHDYFQACAGSTQINASDLNALPTPELSALEEMGSLYVESQITLPKISRRDL